MKPFPKFSTRALLRATFLCVALIVENSISPAMAQNDEAPASQLEAVRYNHPDLHVDLGVGLWAWPLPMDFDGDGDLDLVVVCPDTPYNGTWLFENVSGRVKFPIFRPARRISHGMQNVQVSYVDGQPRVLSPGQEYPDFLQSGLAEPRKLTLPANIHPHRVRANQWKLVDFDGDGRHDLIVGVGDWTDYGWDDAYDKTGRWTNGPLHGYVYWLKNRGTNEEPQYEAPQKLNADGRPIDVYGMPSPNFADFDGDGDLDLICGEFLDGFTYFENIGSRTEPRYAAGRRLVYDGRPLTMDLQMIVPTAVDWDGDGDVDLIVGDEDGRVALVENTGAIADGLPQFLPPRYFQQQADELKCGALATPTAVDWDGDGDLDLLCGNTAGYIEFFENLSGPGVERPRWAAPRRLQADGQIIRIQAGPNGSIQGPCEAKWGYTTLSAADWDGDGRIDLIVNSIWGRVQWYRNLGPGESANSDQDRLPQLAAARPIEVAWTGPAPKPQWNWWNPQGRELVTQWRTTPLALDFNRDGLCDLLMLDHEGYLALFERRRNSDRELELLPGRRIFVDQQRRPLQLNPGRAGKSGRRKLAAVDWDGDGRIDLIVNGPNANWLRNVGQEDDRENDDEPIELIDQGALDTRRLAGHTTSPATVDWNGDGVPDLLIGGEDGRLYYRRNGR